jgi:anthranilate synthase component 2
MKVVIIDNYDSFTYNLSHLIKELGAEVTVLRNDQFELSDLEPYNKIVLSPGPGIPSEAGLLLDVIRTYAGKKPMLGVCLGHQAICEAFGATVTYAKTLMHGKQSETEFDTDCPVFDSIPNSAPVGRYHSLSVDKKTIPDELKITATADDGEVMALCHKTLPVYGLQFHPESILTPYGKAMLQNFLDESHRFMSRRHDSSSYGI